MLTLRAFIGFDSFSFNFVFGPDPCADTHTLEVDVRDRLLVTGTGRCGTLWVAQALADRGVDVGHEVAFSPFRNGEGGWRAEVSWLAAPFTPIANCHTVHLVRHPLDVIRSRVDKGTFALPRSGQYGPWFSFALRYCPEMLAATSDIERAAIHWVNWNQMIVADERVRVEDLASATVNRWAQVAGGVPLGSLPEPNNRTSGSTVSQRPTWDMVQVPNLRDLAEQYGYE